MLPGVRQVASDLGLPLIDINTLLKSRPELFPDNIHLGHQQGALVAEAVFKAVMGQGVPATQP